MHTNYFIDGFGFAQGEALAKDIYNGFLSLKIPCSYGIKLTEEHTPRRQSCFNPGLVIYPNNIHHRTAAVSTVL